MQEIPLLFSFDATGGLLLAPPVDIFDVPKLTPDDPRLSTAFHPDSCGVGDAESCGD